MNIGDVKGWKVVLVAVALAFLSGPVSAEIVSTEQILPQPERERVRTFLNREGVEDRLKALGVAPEDARQRVEAMTPEEIQVVAGRIDALPAGGALDKTDWILILLLVILLVVLL